MEPGRKRFVADAPVMLQLLFDPDPKLCVSPFSVFENGNRAH
jgi:hypothetical protein